LRCSIQLSFMSPPPSPPDSPVPVFPPKNYRETFQKRTVTSQFSDPCDEASKASMDCLNKNDYDRDKCLDFFQAYRDCKKAWVRPTFRAHIMNANCFPRWSNAKQTAELGNTSYYLYAYGISFNVLNLRACFAYSAPKSQDRIHAVQEQHQQHA